MIYLVQRIIDKNIALQKVKANIQELQKEIKENYSLFKPLIENGMPHFWDEDNTLLKKEDYDNLLVHRRNDQSQFENLEGNLGGEVVL
jgi:hypothetical protein